LIIVKMACGLANQMYTYAAGYALARELNRELVLDISACANAHGGGFCLDNFNIPAYKKVKYEPIDSKNYGFETCGSGLEMFPEAVVAVRSLEIKRNYPNSNRVIVYSGLAATQNLSQYKVIYLNGFFFEPDRYFAKYWSELAKQFTLRAENEDVANFKKIITGRISVGVHVRRGDMLIAGFAVAMEDDYYRAAVELYKEMYPECIFCVFSDDIEYTKEMFGYDKAIHYVHFEGFDEASLNELACLTMCNHRIVSNNSTFGRISDELNYDKPRHIMYRDVNEETIGVDIETKKKAHQIWLNKQDIELYSKRFIRFEKEQKESNRKQDNLEKFHSIIEKQQWNSALQFSQEYYFQYRDQESFILGVYKSLMGIGALEEGKLELMNLPIEEFKTYIAKEDNKAQENLLELYQKNVAGKHRRYIIVCNEKMHMASRLQGLAKWITPLTHLGNKVSVIYEPESENAATYFKKKQLYSSRGVDLGCTHYDKNVILQEGVTTFYNQCPEEELVIISRDCRFFVREGVDKKITFVTTDLSDKEDMELNSLYRDGICLIKEMELADYVLTLDERLQSVGNGFIYCDVKKEAAVEVCDTRWEYSFNLRMQDTIIHMVYLLLSKI